MIAAALITAGILCQAGVSGDALTLLRRALEGPSAAFSGIQRTVLALDEGEAAATVRVYADGQGAIRREYVDGAAAGVVIVQRGGEAWKRESDGVWTEIPAAPEPPGGALTRLIERNYLVSSGSTERIAGRDALALRLTPRHPLRPSRRLWVDRLTALILRDELYGFDGKLRSESRFLSLRFGSPPGSLFAPPAEHAHPLLFGPASFSARSAAEVERETGLPLPVPRSLPAGFEPVAYGVMRAGSGRGLPAVRYSDGIVAFTVFRRGRGPGTGRGAGGAGIHSTRQQSALFHTSSNASYLLIGDLPESELKRTAESLP